MMKSSFSLVIGHGKFMSARRKSVTVTPIAVISLRAIFRRSLNLSSKPFMRSAVVVPNNIYMSYKMLVYIKGLPVAKEFGSTGSGISGPVRGDRPILYRRQNNNEIDIKSIYCATILCYYTVLLTWCR